MLTQVRKTMKTLTENVSALDSVIEPSQSNVVQNKRKRRKSQIEEEQPKETEFEPEQDKG